MGEDKTALVDDKQNGICGDTITNEQMAMIRQNDTELEKLRDVIRIQKQMGDTMEYEIDSEDERGLLDKIPDSNNTVCCCWSRTQKILKELKQESIELINILFE